MPKVSPLQNDFSAGELSPYFQGRVNADRYKAGLKTCLNYIPTIQGGLTRRPGTEFINEVKDSTKAVRLVRFEFSTTQAYILEFGDEYIRFYKDYGVILNGGGTPYEVVTPYQEAELFEVNYTQSADVLYLVHPNHKPRKLIRYGHANWVLQDVDFQDGPYLPTNSTLATLTPSAATGTSITITAGPARTITGAITSSGLIKITATAHGYTTGEKVLIEGVTGTTEANGSWTITVVDDNNYTLDGSTFVNAYVAAGTSRPSLFASTDVGRFIRLQQGSVWGHVKILTYVSQKEVTAKVIETLTDTSAKTNFRLGAFSTTTGWPAVVVFHEDRLMFAGAANTPQRLDGSQSGDYENFAPTGLDSIVTANNAVSFSLNSNDVNVIRWMVSDEKGLLAGSVGGEWVVRSASANEALSPTSITAKRATSYGSANIPPIQAGKAALFVQRAGKKIRELNYFFDVDGFRSTDMSLLSEHITQSGLVQLAFQKEPQSIIWGVRNDGILVGMGYDRDVDSLKVGWHKHQLGGDSDSSGAHSAVESIAVIPAPDSTRDDLWLVVRRYIDGGEVRYVECLSKLFEDSDDQEDAFFVDCGLTYDNPLTINTITNANPAVVGVTAHGFANGDKVIFEDVEGMDEINDTIYTVANVAANTFELSGINSTAYGTYKTGTGQVREMVLNISGLDHLEGEEVSILGDGAVQPNKTVTGGAITLSTKAAVVHVGYGYNSDAQMLRIEAGAADGIALGKTRRINRVGFLLHRSLNLKLGASFDDLTRITFRNSSDRLGHAPELYSGIISEAFTADYDFQNEIAWRQDQPLPSTVLAVMPQMTTQDR